MPADVEVVVSAGNWLMTAAEVEVAVKSDGDWLVMAV